MLTPRGLEGSLAFVERPAPRVPAWLTDGNNFTSGCVSRGQQGREAKPVRNGSLIPQGQGTTFLSRFLCVGIKHKGEQADLWAVGV